MPNIEISQSDYVRLQRLAKPFVDTPATVVSRILDIIEGHRPNIDNSTKLGHDVEEYSVDILPPLVHTNLMAAEIGGAKPEFINWNSVIRLVLKLVYENVKSFDETRRISGINIVRGEKIDKGYKFIPDLGFSFQGLSTEDAVKCILRCGRYLKKNVYLEFEWRQKEGAYRPGARGCIKL